MKLIGRIFYYFLKVRLFFGYRLYYRKFQIGGMKNVPTGCPVLFAPNHQNALVDPLVAGGPTIRCPYFLTRGDIFEKKLIGDFMRGLKMLPIFRFRDGLVNVKRNSDSMGISIQKLIDGNSLLIFPEGNHNLQYRLRPLQKGIARIAFDVEEKTGFASNLKIVPVGIHYENHFKGGQRTLVNFGEPISVKEYQEMYEENAREAYDAILVELSARMKPLMVDIPINEYGEIERKWKAARVYRRDLMEQLAVDQEIISQLAKGEEIKPSLPAQSKGLRVYDILHVLLYPFNFLPSLLINIIIKKKVKDPHFYGTFHFTLSLYLFPVFYAVYGLIAWWVFF
ncbi:1-acyl-sn-glycerol-3-phosphate acyltransferase [Flammeovirgaceae bacterium SG7u.111]|nr:1-acyl-sn-glycerol-3-phosphate acyltransferase [Flammeovirgaceae bacterium SG7u.132]WPO36179.1 1-acyl-sn-glycerol-3-phosphate acyltransferase [Flammeovirgaceae bacterium SG7u.111]